MAKTPAQRQAEYRKRRPITGNGERRLNTWISTSASLALRRLAAHHNLSQRQMLERMIISADQQIVDTLDLDTPQWQSYFQTNVTA